MVILRFCIPPQPAPLIARKMYSCIGVLAKEHAMLPTMRKLIADSIVTLRPNISDKRPYTSCKAQLVVV